MDPFGSYKLYLGLKLHFSSKSYDFFKYNGAVKVKTDTFYGRKDKYFFSKFANKYYKDDELMEFYVSNLLVDNSLWIGKFNDDNYNNWLKHRDSRLYLFDEDMSKMFLYLELAKKPFKDVILCGNSHPIILKRYLSHEISIYNLILLNEIAEYFSKLDKYIGNDVIWSELKSKCEKIKPFMDINNRLKAGLIDSLNKHLAQI